MNTTLTLLIIAVVIATASAFGVHTPVSAVSVSDNPTHLPSASANVDDPIGHDS